MDAYLIYAVCISAWLLMMGPAVIYVRTGWVARIERIRSLLTPEYLTKYYELFWPALKGASAADIEANFKERVSRLYGRRHYVLPLALLGIVTAGALWATARTVLAWTELRSDIHPAPAMAIAALLGAYIWVTQDQLTRFRTMDFTVHDVWGGVYRFMLVVPLAYSLAAIFREEAGVPLAFILGAFPTKFLMTSMRRIGAKRLSLGESEETGASELVQLQCVGKSHAERFEDEGYLSVAQIAWADPVDITLRTNFNFYFVFDCQNQALLWVYLGGQVKGVYRYSLRGAQEATYLLERLQSADEATKKGATSDLASAAKALNMEEDALQGTLAEVRDDPYTKFLCELWPEKVDGSVQPGPIRRPAPDNASAAASDGPTAAVHQ